MGSVVLWCNASDVSERRISQHPFVTENSSPLSLPSSPQHCARPTSRHIGASTTKDERKSRGKTAFSCENFHQLASEMKKKRQWIIRHTNETLERTRFMMGRLLVLSEYRLEYYGGLLLLLFLLLHISIKLFFSSFFFACFLRERDRGAQKMLMCHGEESRKTEVKKYFPFHSFEYLDTHFLWAQFAFRVYSTHIFGIGCFFGGSPLSRRGDFLSFPINSKLF